MSKLPRRLKVMAAVCARFINTPSTYRSMGFHLFTVFMKSSHSPQPQRSRKFLFQPTLFQTLVTQLLIALLFLTSTGLTLWAQEQIELQHNAGQYELSLQSESNTTYFLEESTDLNTWTPLPQYIIGDDSTHTCPLTTNEQRKFYRFTKTETNSENPHDTDGDGISNADELSLFNGAYSPFSEDTDNDGTPDGEGLSDGQEDFDGDGLSNAFELKYYTPPSTPLSSFSPSDITTGLLALFKFATQPLATAQINPPASEHCSTGSALDPTQKDTNGDGTPDNYEDSDGDGLDNMTEQLIGTNPLLCDTDTTDTAPMASSTAKTAGHASPNSPLPV